MCRQRIGPRETKLNFGGFFLCLCVSKCFPCSSQSWLPVISKKWEWRWIELWKSSQIHFKWIGPREKSIDWFCLFIFFSWQMDPQYVFGRDLDYWKKSIFYFPAFGQSSYVTVPFHKANSIERNRKFKIHVLNKNRSSKKTASPECWKTRPVSEFKSMISKSSLISIQEPSEKIPFYFCTKQTPNWDSLKQDPFELVRYSSANRSRADSSTLTSIEHPQTFRMFKTFEPKREKKILWNPIHWNEICLDQTDESIDWLDSF